jgi:phosphoglycolate phosphatase
MSKIFLDLDGTLLDVKNKCYRLYVNILLHGGFNILNMEAYWEMKKSKISEEEIASKTTTPVFAKYYAEKRISLVETMDYLVLDSVFDKAYGVLDKWSSCYDLYLVTLRRNSFNLDRQLCLFDLHKYFKCVYNVGESEFKKEELIKHEISGQITCVIVGDTEMDVEAGKSLSIKTAAVTSGLSRKSLLKKTFPDILVKNIYDSKLLSWMENNLQRG